MATQYIKDTKKCKKKFFPNYRGGHGPFWPGGGYAHAKLLHWNTAKLLQRRELKNLNAQVPHSHNPK